LHADCFSDKVTFLKHIKSFHEIDTTDPEELSKTMGLKIHNNLRSMGQGKDFRSNINPSLLATKQKQLPKGAFPAVSELQRITEERLGVIE
jgi:hypothetical protein